MYKNQHYFPAIVDYCCRRHRCWSEKLPPNARRDNACVHSPGTARHRSGAAAVDGVRENRREWKKKKPIARIRSASFVRVYYNTPAPARLCSINVRASRMWSFPVFPSSRRGVHNIIINTILYLMMLIIITNRYSLVDDIPCRVSNIVQLFTVWFQSRQKTQHSSTCNYLIFSIHHIWREELRERGKFDNYFEYSNSDCILIF